MSADRLIVAMDLSDLASAVRLARRLRGLVRVLKVGSILFTACGPGVIERFRALGFDVMLDLKWFDIPSTVELSCRVAARHRVSLLTVHVSGGRAMLLAAVQGAQAEARRLRAARPLVLGVTVLTSVEEGRSASLRSRVIEQARTALQAGCDGIVASAREACALRQRFGSRLRIACPGIRLADGSHHDQARVATPRDAVARGAEWLIVGRPITGARDPRAVVRRILCDMEGVARC